MAGVDMNDARHAAEAASAAYAAGTGISLVEAESLLQYADVSAEDPLAVAARLGLEFVP